MTDTTEGNSRADNRKLIFAALAEAGIHRITVDYDGAGDSGQIESIEAWDAANEKIALPSSRKLQLASDIPDRPVTEISLEAAIETLVFDQLEDTHPGWEIDDGASGTFVFSVPDRSIALEHRARFTDFETTTHQF
jgi:hypothetical protein